MSYGPNSTNDFIYLGKVSLKMLLKLIMSPKRDTLLLIIGKSVKGIRVFNGDGE